MLVTGKGQRITDNGQPSERASTSKEYTTKKARLA